MSNAICTHTRCHKKWCRLYNDHKVQCSTLTRQQVGRQQIYLCQPCDGGWNTTYLNIYVDEKHDSSIVIQYVRWDQDEMQIRKNVTATSLFVTLSICQTRPDQTLAQHSMHSVLCKCVFVRQVLAKYLNTWLPLQTRNLIIVTLVFWTKTEDSKT